MVKKGVPMNSRERVLKAVNFENPDRVPIDLGGIRASGINAVVYDNLKKRMRIDTPTRIHDSMQILAELEMEFVERLHVDVLPLEPNTALWFRQDAREGVRKTLFGGLDVYFQPGTRIEEQEDGSWMQKNADGRDIALMPKGGYYFDFIRPTMSGRRIDPDADYGALNDIARHRARPALVEQHWDHGAREGHQVVQQERREDRGGLVCDAHQRRGFRRAWLRFFHGSPPIRRLTH